MKRPRIAVFGFLIVFALIWARLTLGPRPFDIHDTGWLWGDLSVVYNTWTMFMREPLLGGLTLTSVSAPVPISASLFDPMPIFLLLLRPVAWMFPDGTQYFGLYFSLCLVLQGIFGYMAATRFLNLPPLQAGNVTWLPTMTALAVGIFCITMPFTIHRFSGHTALASQWILLLAIVVSLSLKNASLTRWCAGHAAILFIATGLNPYLAIMCGISTSVFAVFQIGNRGLKDTALRLAILPIVFLFGLFVFGFMSGTGALQVGYGIYTMNMLGPIDSNGHAALMHLDVSDPTGGQTFEGFQYLGLGFLLLLAGSAMAFFRRTIAPNLPILAALVIAIISYALALSNVVTFSMLQITIPIPDAIESLMSRFRGSGRFFWIGAFWLLLFCAAAMTRVFASRGGAAIMICAATLQIVDVYGISASVRSSIGFHQRLALDLDLALASGETAERIIVHPPWQCSPTGTPGGVRNYELFGSSIEQNGISTNSFYAARTPKKQERYHCDFSARLNEDNPDALIILSSELYDAFGQHLSDTRVCASEDALDTAIICR